MRKLFVITPFVAVLAGCAQMPQRPPIDLTLLAGTWEGESHCYIEQTVEKITFGAPKGGTIPAVFDGFGQMGDSQIAEHAVIRESAYDRAGQLVLRFDSFIVKPPAATSPKDLEWVLDYNPANQTLSGTESCGKRQVFKKVSRPVNAEAHAPVAPTNTSSNPHAKANPLLTLSGGRVKDFKGTVCKPSELVLVSRIKKGKGIAGDNVAMLETTIGGKSFGEVEVSRDEMAKYDFQAKKTKVCGMSVPDND